MGLETIVIKSLDEYEFGEKIYSDLEDDTISQSCYTNFKDILVRTIIHEIHEILDKNGWKIKAFEKNKEEKIFNAFLENGEIKVLLSKKVDGQKDKYKKVIVKFNFSEDEKKRIAEAYVDKILEGYCYLNLCIFVDLNEMNIDEISKALSGEVYNLLSADEIKAKFKDKIEEAIRVLDDDIGDIIGDE